NLPASRLRARPPWRLPVARPPCPKAPPLPLRDQRMTPSPPRALRQRLLSTLRGLDWPSQPPCPVRARFRLALAWSLPHQTGTAEALQIVLPVGFMLDRHLACDPVKRNIGLCPAQFRQGRRRDLGLTGHAGGSRQHSVGADEIAAQPNTLARKAD